MYFEPMRMQRALKIHALTPKSLAIRDEKFILIKSP